MVNFEGFWHFHRINHLSSSSPIGGSCGKGGLNFWFLFLVCLAGASSAIRSLFPKNWACILIFLLVHWGSSVGSGYCSCLLGLKWLPGLGQQNPFIFVSFLTGFKCSRKSIRSLADCRDNKHSEISSQVSGTSQRQDINFIWTCLAVGTVSLLHFPLPSECLAMVSGS